MNYYLKYLKYKKKYLDLKNLDLNGGVIGLRIFNRNNPGPNININVERFAAEWDRRRIGPVSADRNIGYYLMLDNLHPTFDDRENHIHIYNIINNNTNTSIGITYSLKILDRHVQFTDYELNNLIDEVLSRGNWNLLLPQIFEDNLQINPLHYVRDGDAQNNMMIIPLNEYALDNSVTRLHNIAKILLVLRTIMQRRIGATS